MKKLVVFLTFILATMVMAVVVSAADLKVEASDARQFTPDNGNFYLPSYISPRQVKVVYENAEDRVEYKDASGTRVSVKNGSNIDIVPFKVEYPNGQVVYRATFYVNGSIKSYTFNFADKLPSIHIETTLGRDYIAKNNAKDTDVKITVINQNGSFEYADTTKTSTIKVRGNATKAYAKKPFQIKLTEKADLYGMGESKTWILLANYDDQSLIRNNVMYKIGELLGMHTCEFKSVDLWMDGQYYGVYLLCEKVNISSERINITELEKLNDALNPTYQKSAVKVSTGIKNTIITEYTYIPGVVNPVDITGGYLVELDNNYWESELCYFVTRNGSHYVVKSPEYASKEQMEYIATLFGEMEEAIMSSTGYNRLGKHYSEYVDVDSLAYAYIAAELGRNYDAGSSSMYFYKDADKNGEFSKIVKGPLWDCDNTLGNIHKNGASNPEGYWARGRSIWSGLVQHSDFNVRVTNALARVYDDIFDMIDIGGFVYDEVMAIGQSIHMERARWRSNDYSKWPVYYDGTHYDRWQAQAPIFNFVSGYYSNGVDDDDSTVIGYLCEHLEARLNWLATEWNCNVALRERSFTVKANIVIEQSSVDLLKLAMANPLLCTRLASIKLNTVYSLVESGEAVIVSDTAKSVACTNAINNSVVETGSNQEHFDMSITENVSAVILALPTRLVSFVPSFSVIRIKK